MNGRAFFPCPIHLFMYTLVVFFVKKKNKNYTRNKSYSQRTVSRSALSCAKMSVHTAKGEPLNGRQQGSKDVLTAGAECLEQTARLSARRY